MQPPAWQPPGQQPPGQQPPAWQPAGQPAWRPPVPDAERPVDAGQRVSVLDALRFPFSDANWTNNLLISSVFMFIPLVGPLANAGWHAEIHQRLARRHANPIPRLEFSDLMHYMSRGAASFFVALILMLPMGLISYLGIIVAVFGGAAVGAAVNEPLVMAVVWILIGLLGFMFMSLAMMMVHAAQARAELTEDLGQSISPGNLFRFLGKTWGTVLVSSMLFALVSMLMFFAGYLMCVFGLYPAMVVVTIAASHLRWQFYERYLTRGGAPFALKEPQQLPSEAAAAYHAAYQAYQNQGQWR